MSDRYGTFSCDCVIAVTASNRAMVVGVVAPDPGKGQITGATGRGMGSAKRNPALPGGYLLHRYWLQYALPLTSERLSPGPRS